MAQKVQDGDERVFWGESPLNMASSRVDSDLVNHRGRSTLHMESVKGNHDIVSGLVPEDDPDICTARDVDGRNPLHLAAIYGRGEVLKLLVQRCPHAAEARADRGETILHLCFKYNHKVELRSLISISKIQELVNAKDDDGNTLLHLAVADQNTPDINLEILTLLLDCGRIDTSAKNSQGETPLDVALENKRATKTNAKQQVKALLKQGARRGNELRNLEWLASKKDALMVVASLMATIAFQAGVSPPGGIWQDNKDGHKAGEAVMAFNNPGAYPHYLRLNAVAFVGSMSIIMSLLIREPPFMKKFFMWQLVVSMWAAVVTMTISYLVAIAVVTPDKDAGPLPSINFGVLGWGLLMLIYTGASIFQFVRNASKSRRLETGMCKKFRGLGKWLMDALRAPGQQRR